jgi:soluble lytic murein transglycosylase-like protein/Flp pilus assembly protein TadD
MTTFLPLLLITTLFSPTVERAFDSLERGDYQLAAMLLDESAAIEPEYFERNNMPFLRGRVAELQEDWARAEQEFSRIESRSVLHPLSLWHRARVALEEGRNDDAIGFLDRLPSNFPARRRLELAPLAVDMVALRIYDSVNTRESRWRRAELRNDTPTMWQLLAQSRTDDIALEIALHLHEDVENPSDDQRMLLARTLHGQRIFGSAAALFGSLLEHTRFGPEAHYELGRTYFQQVRYEEAIEVFLQTVRRFPDTDWEKDAETQIASSYWRKLDFAAAEAAYLALIDKYEERRDFQSFVRDLIDIYRSQGDTRQALEWITRGLEGRPAASNRAVLTFTRAKTLYHAGRYREALSDLEQLQGMSLRSVANGTDRTEVRFLEAITLEQLGRIDEASVIWRDLADDPFTYYGLQSLAKLDDPEIDGTALQRRVWDAMSSGDLGLCERGDGAAVSDAIKQRRLARTRGFRIESTPETDLVGELVFLRQWDEAFYWANLAASRWRDDALADLAYLASDFRRAMLYGDRLRPASGGEFFSLDGDYSDERRILMAMLYPASFPDELCRESADAGVNPLWLRSIIWQESRYDPNARSAAAARGLMQFIPETAAKVADRMGMGEMTPERMYSPEVSIRLGANYWAELMDEFGSPEFALASYNGGPHNVRRWSAKTSGNNAMLFMSDIGFVQTKNYVSQIFGLYARYVHLQ